MRAAVLALSLVAVAARVRAGDHGPSESAIAFQGEPVTIELRDVSFRQAVRALIPSMTLVVERGLGERRVSVSVDRRPWDEAASGLLQAQDAHQELQGATLLVMPRDLAGREAEVGCMDRVLVADPADRSVVHVTWTHDRPELAVAVPVSSRRELVLDVVGSGLSLRLVREDVPGPPRVRVTLESAAGRQTASLGDGETHAGALGTFSVGIRAALPTGEALERERSWTQRRRALHGR